MGRKTNLQEQARALGDPTRHQIFQHIAESDTPVDVAELTSLLKLNHNAIRQHLAKLEDAGLVSRETRSAGTPGRPRLVFRVDPAADGRWTARNPYATLSILLLDIASSGASPEDVGYRAGRELEIDRPATADDRVVAMAEAIARGGFEPRVRRRENTVEYVLANCPFAEAAAEDPDTVCGLHLGLARGLASRLEGMVVDELIRRNPHRAGCRLRCRMDAIDREASSS